MGNHPVDQKGFSLVEIVLVIVAIVVLCILGGLVYKNHKKTTVTTHNSATNSSKSGLVSLNGITISSPENGATKGRTFNITGKAPAADSGDNVSLNIVIDNSETWTYNGPTSGFTVSSNGHYSMPLNLNGSKALENITPVTGGYTYKYESLSPGRHTFKVDENRLGTIDNIAQIISGPTLTLYIQ